jgi:alcohol dehydrogenase (cytochrome c)
MTRDLLVFSALLVNLLAAGPAFAQTERSGWESITEERLAHPEDGDWLNYRRTHDVQAFSPLDEINRTNVERLRPVWSYSFTDNSRWSPTPMVANGIMYVSEGSGTITAMDAVRGDVLWVHQRSFPDDIRISMAYPRSRGVAVFEDKVYWGTADSYLVVLDALTGDQLWEVQTDDYHLGAGHAHPPMIADGKVLLGTTGNALGISGARGKIDAYDAESGERLWRTYTVPSRGDPAYETWSADETGVPPLGGSAWHTFSYDAELGLIYAGTGQPTPRNRVLRGPGDALYTASILALDFDTGEIRWYFQVMPGESWDYDQSHESMLIDLVIDGQPRKALVHTSKIGWGQVLDRETGEFLFAFRTGYDNVVTGWTDEGRPIYNAETQPRQEHLDSGTTITACPHLHGTRDLNSPSYSPLTGLYYTGINYSCQVLTYFAQEFIEAGRYQGMTGRPALAPGYDYVGEFVAFDPATGERAWVYKPESGAPMSASALATAGGIVFGGTSDRWFFALHTETGELLWEMRLNGDISGSPVTFTVDGKQYVAVGAGGRIAQTTTLGRLVDIDIPSGSGVMWVFALPEGD